jgi:hypothetical protein
MLHATLYDARVPHVGVLFVVRRMPFAYDYLRDICYNICCRLSHWCQLSASHVVVTCCESAR